MAKVKKKAIKVKKKHWFKVIAPKVFDEAVLGETYVAEAGLMKDKSISLNLKCFAYRMSKQNISVGFKINEIKEDKAYCTLVKYNLLQASVKRLASRGKEKIMDSFVIKSQDGKNVRIKFILITTGKVSNSSLTAIRNALRVQASNMLAGIDYEDILLQTITYKIQPKLKRSLAKIYPLRACAIKELYIEQRKSSLKHVIEGTPIKKIEKPVEKKSEIVEKVVEKKPIIVKEIKKEVVKKSVEKKEEVKEIKKEEVKEVKVEIKEEIKEVSSKKE